MSQPWPPNQNNPMPPQPQWGPPPAGMPPAQWGPPPQPAWQQPGMPPYPMPRQGASVGVVFGIISMASAVGGLLILPILLGPVAAICGVVALACHGGDSRAKGMGWVGLLLGLLDTLIVMSALSALF